MDISSTTIFIPAIRRNIQISFDPSCAELSNVYSDSRKSWSRIENSSVGAGNVLGGIESIVNFSGC